MQAIKKPYKSKLLSKFLLWELYELNDDYKQEKRPFKYENATTHCFNALEELGIIKTMKVGKERLFAKRPEPTEEIVKQYCKITNKKVTKEYVIETKIRLNEYIKSPDFKPKLTIKESENLFGDSNFENVIKTLVIQSRDFSIDYLDYATKKEKELKELELKTKKFITLFSEYAETLDKPERAMAKAVIGDFKQASELMKEEKKKKKEKFKGLNSE